MALVPDQKFSTFQDGGDLDTDDTIVGLRNGVNTKFNFPGYVPPGQLIQVNEGGTGADNAADARTNLGLGSMAVQDANAVAILGGSAVLDSGQVAGAPGAGTDIVNKTYADGLNATSVKSVSGTANRISSSGGVNPVIDIVANAVLPGTGGLTLPQGDTAARAGGAGTIRFNTQSQVFESTFDGVTWAIIDTSTAGDVDSITGTANQVIASSPTGNVVLSLPQSIGTTSSPTFNNVTLNGSVLDSTGATIFRPVPNPSAVNYIQVFNNATASDPGLSANGSDANINIRIIAKGTGINRLYSTSNTPLQLFSGTANQHNTTFSAANTAASRTITLPDASGTMLMSGQAISTVPSISFGGTALTTFETGTWTPTISTTSPGNLVVVYTSQAASYTRINNRVFFSVLVAGTVTYTTATGSVTIDGFPFASTDANVVFFASPGGTSFTVPANLTQFYGAIAVAATRSFISYNRSNAAGGSALAITAFPTASSVVYELSGSYLI